MNKVLQWKQNLCDLVGVSVQSVPTETETAITVIMAITDRQPATPEMAPMWTAIKITGKDITAATAVGSEVEIG